MLYILLFEFMFSYSYNYILFFFNYELIIPTCFFFFLFFVLISDKGQIGNSLKELSFEYKTKLSKHLILRETILQELTLYLDRSISQIKRISLSYEITSHDILFYIQFIVKKLTLNYTILQIKYYHDILITRTQSLSLEIKHYFTQHLFIEKSYDLTKLSHSNSLKKISKLRISNI